MYEIQMLFYLRDYLHFSIVDEALEDRQDKGLPARNALIEAFGTHLRNLVTFFYERCKLDDLEADDYVRDKQAYWNDRPKRHRRLSDREVKRVSREIVHLTSHRSSSAAHMKWLYDDICDALVPVIDVFLEHVDPAKVEQASQPRPSRPAKRGSGFCPGRTARSCDSTRARSESPRKSPSAAIR
jgi:hypothetical protein